MKKILFLLSFAVIVMSFAGCAKSNHDKSDEKTEKVEKNTPKAVVARYISYLQKCEFEKALALTTLSEEQQKQYAAIYQDKETDEMKKEMAAITYKIGEVNEAKDGKSATVYYTIKNKDGEEQSEQFNLEKIDGKWRIRFF